MSKQDKGLVGIIYKELVQINKRKATNRNVGKEYKQL